jgi:hypothetical protein
LYGFQIPPFEENGKMGGEREKVAVNDLSSSSSSSSFFLAACCWLVEIGNAPLWIPYSHPLLSVQYSFPAIPSTYIYIYELYIKWNSNAFLPAWPFCYVIVRPNISKLNEE